MLVRKRGFTLVELLVVISIISLLLAILIPTLQTAREQSRSTVCNSNIKQWGLVFAMYTNEYNGDIFPCWSGSLSLLQPGDYWTSALRKYYRQDKLRLCPSATKKASETRVPSNILPNSWDQAWGVFPKSDPYWAGEVGMYGSYGINGWLCNTRLAAGASPPSLLSDKNWRNAFNVKNPRNVPFMLDAFWIVSYPYSYDPAPQSMEEARLQGMISTGYGMSRFLPVRHIRGKSNVTMMDGSAISTRPKDLWYFTWHRNYELRYPPVWPAWMR